MRAFEPRQSKSNKRARLDASGSGNRSANPLLELESSTDKPADVVEQEPSGSSGDQLTIAKTSSDVHAVIGADAVDAVAIVQKQDAFVPKHGNYRGYYTKRRFVQDPSAGDSRLALIPKEWLHGKYILDVGCNEGKVTVEIAQLCGPKRVTGVDIDGELIRRAQRNVRIAWSRQEPVPSIKAAVKAAKDNARHKTYVRRDASRSPSPIESDKLFIPKPSHFPIALSRMFGCLPQLSSSSYLHQYVKPDEEESRSRAQRRNGKVSRGAVMPVAVRLFASNIAFKKADWVNDEIESDRRGYHCILAFSVSKWIHLNGGDQGLRDFFARVFIALLPSGRFILEPQPWQSYHKATRLSDELRESYGNLQLRPDDFERILLEDIGFKSVEKLLTDTGKGFKRPLYVFQKSAGTWM